MVNTWKNPLPGTSLAMSSFSGGQLFGNHPGGEFRPNGFHNGLDFGSLDHPGNEIHAVNSGSVIFAGNPGISQLGALVIVIRTNDINVVYQEFSTTTANSYVKTGDQVVAGQVIGIRNTNHLHLGMTRMDWRQAQQYAFTNNGTWLDPLPILTSGSSAGGEYNMGSLTNAGKQISQQNIVLVIKHARKYNLKPSFLIAQMFVESHWGDPAISIVGNIDNNWSGISEPFRVPADLGITMSRGSARPSNEGGYYVHFDTMDDFFNAYTFILSRRNGIYNVEGTTTIESFCKGLFRVGGASADYAASGYNHYLSLLVPTYNAIKNQNPGKLEAIDLSNSSENGETINSEGETNMQCLYQVDGKDAVYYFDGKEVRPLTHPDEMKVLQNIYKANNGKDMPFFGWTSSVPWHYRLKGILERPKSW